MPVKIRLNMDPEDVKKLVDAFHDGVLAPGNVTSVTPVSTSNEDAVDKTKEWADPELKRENKPKGKPGRGGRG